MVWIPRARKRILIAASLLLAVLLAAAVLNALRGEPTLADMPVLGEERLRQLTETGTETRPNTLRMNGVDAAWDEERGCYYVPQSLATDSWDGQLAAGNGYTLYRTPEADGLMSQKTALLRSGVAVQLIAVRRNSWYTVDVVFTGMPMMVWTTTGTTPRLTGNEESLDSEVDEPDLLNVGTVRYFSGDTLQVQISDMTWRVRGGASRGFDKLGYKLNLRDGQGKNRNLSFGGMRSDDDWILRSLYTDPQKVREKAATTIWNEIAASAPAEDPKTADMEYVELVIDGEYMGLFGLCERLDDKEVGVSGSDILYKYVNYGCPTALRFEQAEERGETVLLDRGVRIYGLGDRARTLWTPLQQVIFAVYTAGHEDTGFSGGVTSASESAEAMNMPYTATEDYQQLLDILDVENAIDWGFFNQALQLADSDLNNTYMLARDEGAGYRIHFIPWDMDYSFGTFNGGAQSRTIPEYYRKLRSTYALNALLRADPSRISTLGQTRWNELRATALETGHVWQLIEDANAHVVDSGAFARDTARWPQCENDESLEYIKQYIKDRLEFLDVYYMSADWTDFD